MIFTDIIACLGSYPLPIASCITGHFLCQAYLRSSIDYKFSLEKVKTYH